MRVDSVDSHVYPLKHCLTAGDLQHGQHPRLANIEPTYYQNFKNEKAGRISLLHSVRVLILLL